MGSSGTVNNNHIYIAGQNLSTGVWYGLSISIAQKNIEWATSFPNQYYNPIVSCYSAALRELIIVAGSNGYTWIVNSTKSVNWGSSGYGQQGTYDQSLQEFWGVGTSSIYRQNIVKQTETSIPNTYNVVVMAISSSRQALYCVAQAADGSLLYLYDTYLNTWSFVGCLSNMVPIINSASVLDSTESYLSFQASVQGKISIVTVSLDDASILYSVASPDPNIIMLQDYM